MLYTYTYDAVRGEFYPLVAGLSNWIGALSTIHTMVYIDLPDTLRKNNQQPRATATGPTCQITQKKNKALDNKEVTTRIPAYCRNKKRHGPHQRELRTFPVHSRSGVHSCRCLLLTTGSGSGAKKLASTTTPAIPATTEEVRTTASNGHWTSAQANVATEGKRLAVRYI